MTEKSIQNVACVSLCLCVMVCVRVGREFPDMRQNEREIKFARVGDADRTVGQLQGELMLNRGP